MDPAARIESRQTWPVSLYRRAGAAALVVSPALVLGDNLLHPREAPRGHESEQLAAIAAAYPRWQLAHLLGLAATVVFAAAMLALAFMVARRQPRLGLAGGILGIAGLFGVAGALALDGYTWGVLGQLSAQPGVDAATVERALRLVQGSPWSIQFYALGGAWPAGLLVLALGAVRQRAIPAWAGVALSAAAVMLGTETAVPSNAYFVAGAAVLLLGGAGAAVALARMTDEEFAAGGRPRV